MNTAVNTPIQQHSATVAKNIIIIGAGPVGVRVLTELRKKNIPCQVTLFGNEAYEPYNRVQLSNLLSRSKDYEDIITQLPDSTESFSFTYRQQHVKKILPEDKKIITRNGEEYHYDDLVIATGSTPFVPHIEGADLTGVYTFRNLRDAEALMTRSLKSRKVVVVGGGLLGLEAARALKKYHTEVVLMQQADRLMNRQLDEKAAGILKEYVESLDVWVAGLHVGRGITVNDQLQTSNDNIYAIGECCEHQGVVYGIVAPGFEQAAVVADNFANGHALARKPPSARSVLITK